MRFGIGFRRQVDRELENAVRFSMSPQERAEFKARRLADVAIWAFLAVAFLVGVIVGGLIVLAVVGR